MITTAIAVAINLYSPVVAAFSSRRPLTMRSTMVLAQKALAVTTARLPHGSRLFEGRRNRTEGRVKLGAQGLHDNDNSDRDPSSDQSIFDSCCGIFITTEANDALTHCALPSAGDITASHYQPLLADKLIQSGKGRTIPRTLCFWLMSSVEGLRLLFPSPFAMSGTKPRQMRLSANGKGASV